MTPVAVAALCCAFALFVLGQRLYTSAAVHFPGWSERAVDSEPGSLTGIGFFSCTVSQSLSTALDFAIGRGVAGRMRLRDSALLMVGGSVLLPFAAVIPLWAGGVLLTLGIILALLERPKKGRWGLASVGIALYSVAGALIVWAESVLIPDETGQAIIAVLFSPAVGFVIALCLSFLFRSASAVAAFIACAGPDIFAPDLWLLYWGCILGEMLGALTRPGDRDERRLTLRLIALQAGSLALLALLFYLLRPVYTSVWYTEGRLREMPLVQKLVLLSLSGYSMGIAGSVIALLPMRVFRARFAVPDNTPRCWHPRFVSVPPAGLSALRAECCAAWGKTRADLETLPEALAEGNAESWILRRRICGASESMRVISEALDILEECDLTAEERKEWTRLKGIAEELRIAADAVNDLAGSIKTHEELKTPDNCPADISELAALEAEALGDMDRALLPPEEREKRKPPLATAERGPSDGTETSGRKDSAGKKAVRDRRLLLKNYADTLLVIKECAAHIRDGAKTL